MPHLTADTLMMGNRVVRAAVRRQTAVRRAAAETTDDGWHAPCARRRLKNPSSPIQPVASFGRFPRRRPGPMGLSASFPRPTTWPARRWRRRVRGAGRPALRPTAAHPRAAHAPCCAPAGRRPVAPANPGSSWICSSGGCGMHIPPLVTSGPTADQPGFLNENTTQILFGNDTINDQLRAGGRLVVGTWLDCCHCVGVEGDYLALDPESTHYRILVPTAVRWFPGRSSTRF